MRNYLFPTFRGYQRQWLRGDLLAGVTIGAIAIPGQIAVAKVAGMPPTTGLWAFVAAGVFACVFVANRVLCIAADSTTAPLVFAGLSVAAAPASHEYVRLAVTLALLIGLILLVVAVFRLQWLADLLSRPVMVGFMAGVAVTIIVGQLPALLGIPSGGTHTLEKLWHVLTNLSQINWVATAIGVSSLVLLAVFGRINRKLPGALLVIVLATLATAAMSLTQYNVETLGPLQTGLPQWVWPNFSLDALRLLLPSALAISLIAIAQTAATSRTSADAGGFTTSLRQDFAGLAFTNFASGGLGSFNVDGSPGSTVVMQSSGARSQLGNLIGGLFVLCIVLFAGGLLADLPSSTLAAVMILLSVRIVDVRQMRRIRAYGILAWLLMAVTLLAVVILGVEVGLVIAVALALANRAVRSSRPELFELGRRSDGHWLPIQSDAAHHTGDIVCFRLNGPIWFANASWFHDEIKDRLFAQPSFRKVILDATGVDDLDYTGSSTLLELVETLEDQGYGVAVATIPGRTQESLRKIDLRSVLPADHVFASVEDAFRAMNQPDWTSSPKVKRK